MKKTAAWLLSIALLFPPAALAQQAPPPPSFLNVVAMGDSLALGVRSGSLNSQDQIEAFPALIARQAGTFFFLPLIFGPTIELVEPGLPPVTETIPAGGQGRVFPLIVTQNTAIGGHDVLDALNARPDFQDLSEIDDLEDLILGLPLNLAALGDNQVALSQVELAVALQPSFTIFWLGSNDVLGAATSADPSVITPFEVFQQAYQQALGALLTLTPSQVIVANIPDVTRLAFLQSAQEVEAIVGAPLAAIGPILGIEEGDFVTLLGLGLIEPILMGEMAGPLPPDVVFTAAEAASTAAAVDGFNAFIDQFAGAVGVPVVDINGFLRDADENGFQVGQFTLTTNFLGGIFSLDGVHPTATAQALVANRFITRMNEFWGLNIPLVDAAAVAAEDQLVIKAGEEALQARKFSMLRSRGFAAARKAADIILRLDRVERPQRPSGPSFK